MPRSDKGEPLRPRLNSMNLRRPKHVCDSQRYRDVSAFVCRNTGFADSSIRCQFKDLPPVLGYAATARIRSAGSADGRRWLFLLRSRRLVEAYPHRCRLRESPLLKISTIAPGLGAFVGVVHAQILKAWDVLRVVD